MSHSLLLLWSNLHSSLEAACLALRHQHETDLTVYQSSHQDWKNRWLHNVLIPIECFSAFLLITGVSFRVLPLSELQLNLLLVLLVGFSTGLISLVISPANHPWVGLASFGFMMASPWISCVITKRYNQSWRILAVSLLMWITASSLQVAVGHWLWEKNSPDVLSSDEVSWLSLSHSVQIAWSS